MTEDKRYCVYVHINIINDKKYIGITSKNPITRWRKNGNGYKKSKYFWNAIQKYGWDKFKHVILHDNLSENEAKQMEKVLISNHKSNNRKFGYNITEGGDGGSGVKLTKEQLEHLKSFIIKKVVRFNKNNVSDNKAIGI